jgi:hypothetical protein
MMTSFTERFTEVNEFSDDLFPANRAAATYNTGWHRMNVFHRAVCIIRVGAMTQGALFDVLLQEAQDALGTNAAFIGGKQITQLTQAGGDGNDTLVIELRSEEMTPGYDHVRAVVVIANAAVQCDVLFLRFVPSYAAVNVAPLTEVVD